MNKIQKLQQRINKLFDTTQTKNIKEIEDAYSELILSFTVDNKFIQDENKKQNNLFKD